MVRIVPADLTCADHADGITTILDSYADTPLSSTVRQELTAGLRRHPTTHILLAIDDDTTPIGTAICFLGFSTFLARPLLNLHDLAVLPGHQGRGIGRMLLASVEELARDLKCCKVTLEVRESNPRAKALYYRSGFEDPGGSTFFLERRL